MTERWDVIVIGGSAAGLSAALMLGRACRNVLVVDASEPRNRFSAHMHGVLGHDGDEPATLLERGRQEISAYGVELRRGLVTGVTEQEDGVEVSIEGAGAQHARAVIVASGMTDRLPDVPGLAKYWGTSVLHCPYCHGWEVRGRRLGVLTTSPIGLHQAQLIRQWSEQVVVFTAGLEDLDEATRQRLRARDMRLVGAPVTEVLGDDKQLRSVHTSDGELIELDALFTAPEAVPHDGFLAHLGLERGETPMGSFLTVDATGKTGSERIWAAGNVVNPAANVSMSINAGTVAAGAVNMALIMEDFDQATTGPGV
ncbi:NAD(P)/FAD-dependent oxidoreductase [Streptomyces sp. NPDC058374]|uniref:NAD(P)/FAD-dependent oxidoreductase n=1 Tax=Streptomyces sp. NPDC058374 TaxID=3346466 RepID=UPI0036584114